MRDERTLVQLLSNAVRKEPRKVAIVVPGGERVTYAQLDDLSSRVCERILQLGVLPGDRVGLRMRKSASAVAMIFGILKAGATYVPVDASAPVSRVVCILDSCGAKVVVTDRSLWPDTIEDLKQSRRQPSCFIVEDGTTVAALIEKLAVDGSVASTGSAASAEHPDARGLAYILYTSGSTGVPKGVMLSHQNALSFIDWCTDEFSPIVDDVFSSHAPFHFDLSIFDIFVCIKHVATLVLINEEIGKQPLRLAEVIASERITIWYSTPSILGLLARYGKLHKHDLSALRIILFAGEVFPVQQCALLRKIVPGATLYNLYGPTETNVCTAYPIADEDFRRSQTFPIGRVCRPNIGVIADERGNRVERGTAGELLISGPNVMQGYWGLPDQTSRAFLTDADGIKWYRTGDIVVEEQDVGFLYLGRKDRMVKRRGYRVELGEIEATLLGSVEVQEAALVATPDAESGVRLTAFVSRIESSSITPRELRSVLVNRLPSYMIPDVIVIVPQVPRSSTDKVDYKNLEHQVLTNQLPNSV